MKKNIKKLNLKKATVTLLNPNEQKQLKTGMLPKTFIISCRIACGPTQTCKAN
jgi:hypothetical protein